MNKQTIKQMIGQLEEFAAQQALLSLTKQEKRDELIPLEIRTQLAELDAEFVDQEQAVIDNMEALKAQIRDAVVLLGEKVQGDTFEAVYKHGSLRVNAEQLLGYSIEHPEVKAFFEMGKPSVAIQAIRSTKGKK